MNGSTSNESWLLIMTIVIADVIRISNTYVLLSLAYLGHTYIHFKVVSTYTWYMYNFL